MKNASENRLRSEVKTWETHSDLQPEGVQLGQVWARESLAIAAAVHPDEFERGGAVLPPWICQARAARQRAAIECSAAYWFDWLEAGGAQLFLVTIVDPKWRSAQVPLTRQGAAVIRDQMAGYFASDTDILAAIGGIEFDLIELESEVTHWQRHVHALVAVAAASPEEGRRKLKLAFRKVSRKLAGGRPVHVKAAYQPHGVIRYSLKSLNARCVRRRATWRSDDGRARTHHKSLRSADVIALLRTLKSVDPLSRVITHNFAQLDGNFLLSSRQRYLSMKRLKSIRITSI